MFGCDDGFEEVENSGFEVKVCVFQLKER